MYVLLGLLFVATLVLTVWLVKHPLVLVSLNVVPVAWWMAGAAGAALAAVLLICASWMLRSSSPAQVG
jgi:hypothetical protein